MIEISKDAFTITHFDSLIANGTLRRGTNLLTNPKFEAGSLTGWTNSNWTAISATSVEPNASGNYAAQAASAAKGDLSTLDSDRVAVSGAGDYIASLFFAAPNGSPRRANHLKVTVKWYDAPTGGTLLRTDTLWASPLKARPNGMRHVQMRLTAPGGATHAALFIKNRYGSETGGAGYGAVVDNALLAGVLTISQLSALDMWLYEDKQVYFRNLKYSWNDQYGCKQLTFRVYAPTEYLAHMLDTALGDHVETHFENERVFSGMLWTMAGRVGKRALSISLDALANVITVPYRDTAFVGMNAESVLQYGRKDMRSDKTFSTLADARSYADYLLNAHAFPIAGGDDTENSERDYLDITVNGLFATLQWVNDLPPIFEGYVDSSEAIATLEATVYGGRSILDRVRQETANDFLSGDYALCSEVGRDVLPFDTTEGRSVQDLILDLFGRGGTRGRRIVGGVNADRKFFMRVRPTTVSYYRETDGDNKFSYWDAGGNEVPRPLVKCGEFVTEGHAVPSFAIVLGSDAARDAANRYITEIEYDHERNAVRAQFLGQRRFGLDLAKVIRRSGS
jgi:hypothetical protein